MVALTGDAGLGKTVLINTVLADSAEPVRTVAAPRDDVLGALRDMRTSIQPGTALGTPCPGILVIYDAHHLPPDVLRQLASLLEDSRPYLPRVVLLAQPAFWSMLGRPALAALLDALQITSRAGPA